MIRGLLALTALLAWTPALNLPSLALARRRLKKSSIYLFRKNPRAQANAGAVSANSADSSSFSTTPPQLRHPHVRHGFTKRLHKR